MRFYAESPTLDLAHVEVLKWQRGLTVNQLHMLRGFESLPLHLKFGGDFMTDNVPATQQYHGLEQPPSAFIDVTPEGATITTKTGVMTTSSIYLTDQMIVDIYLKLQEKKREQREDNKRIIQHMKNGRK